MKIKGRESVLYFPSDRDLQGIRTMRCPVDHVTRGISPPPITYSGQLVEYFEYETLRGLARIIFRDEV